MMTHKQMRAAALTRPKVKAEFAALSDEFALLDGFLKARAARKAVKRSTGVTS